MFDQGASERDTMRCQLQGIYANFLSNRKCRELKPYLCKLKQIKMESIKEA